MIDSVLLIFTVAGIFSVIDSLTSEKTRVKMSEYIFGVHGLTAKNYEQAVMEAWLSSFMKDGKVSVIRSLALSSLITCALVLISFVLGGSEAVLGSGGILGAIAVLFWMSICGTPVEYINLRISQAIYFGNNSHRSIGVKFILDFLYHL